jgi:hypothetical protein
VAAVVGAAEGDALTELLGLNKSPSVNLPGDADATGLAAGVAAVSVLALRTRFALGEAGGDSAVEGEAAFSAGEAVASAFLCVRCFAGEGDAAGDPLGAGD